MYGSWLSLHRNLGQSLHYKLTSNLHRKTQMSKGAWWCACSAMTTTWLHSCGDRVNLCSCIDAQAWSKPGGRRLPEQWATSPDLIRLHAIDCVIVCLFICNRNLAYDKVTRLDCCDVITTTGDYGMSILTLGRLFFVLPSRLTPTDVVSVAYRRCAGSGSTKDLHGPHLHLERA
jgi:hypothetical protein